MAGNEQDNDRARDAWNANAQFWDDRMGEGNDFFRVLLWPAVEKLLQPRAGVQILDVACGNGLTSRRLAKLGANVTAVDFARALLDLARGHGDRTEIDYRVVDATQFNALIALGEARFDAALCNMALMDLADIQPLMMALPRLLRPGGTFVFSVLHPCFNNPSTVQMAELADREGAFEMTYSVKVSRYLTPYTQVGAAMHGQPVPHPYFHRSLTTLVGAGLRAGLVLDGLEEPAFPASYSGGTTALSWSGNFSEIPPVVVIRMRRATA
jgi:2-polyprenyl-3-methyl-5-hydroxy-6-metoxy-1,4-benzoquinol methylase